MVGAVLLHSPFCCQGPVISWLEALFTATSAVCVTGLVVVDTGQEFTRAGQSVILLLIQMGGLGIDEDGITGADGSIELTLDPAGLPSEVTDKFPHLSGYPAFTIDDADLNLVPMILKGQFAVSAAGSDGTPVDATALRRSLGRV